MGTELTRLERRVLHVALDFEEQIREVLSYDSPEATAEDVADACRSLYRKLLARYEHVTNDPQISRSEQMAVQEVLERVRQIVGNNDPSWTSRYGHQLLKEALTQEALVASEKLPAGPYRCSLIGVIH